MKNRIYSFVIALLLAILVFIISGNEGSGQKPLPHYPNTMQQVAKNYQDQEAVVATADFVRYAKADTTIEEYWDVPLSIELQIYIRRLCEQYGVDEQLAYAVMKTESNFNPNVISPTQDYGLFQINRINFDRLQKKFGRLNFLNSFDNAKAGIYMLSELQQQSDDQHFVLTAYNRGVGGTNALASRGGFSTSYSRKVISTISTLEKVKVELTEER